MKYICFELTMPHCGSWNGKWSQENKGHFILKSVSNKFFKENKNRLIGSWTHRWDDGWEAEITGKEITAVEKKKLHKINAGFCGYNWMVDSIMLVGSIHTSSELRKILIKEGEYGNHCSKTQ